MSQQKRDYSVLVVSGKEQSARLLSAMLLSFGYRQCETATSLGEAKRKLLISHYDIIIIDSPLPERVCRSVEDYGVLTVPKPVENRNLYAAVKLVTAAAAKLSSEEKKIQKLQDKLEELKMVTRAKFILIEKYRMTEAEAHRLIEKDAMDSRRSKAQVAKESINKE